MLKLSRAAASLAAAAALAAGLMTSTAALASAFDVRMSALIEHVKADPNYKRIPLETTDDRRWFSQKSKALYDKRITKEEFVAEGNKNFPGYEASFVEVADFLTTPAK
jgi:hypothetical protein